MDAADVNVLLLPIGVIPRSERALVVMGAEPPAIIDLDSRRSPVTYTVRLKHWHDGRMSIWVQNASDTPEDRLLVAAALREAANVIESRTVFTEKGTTP